MMARNREANRQESIARGVIPPAGRARTQDDTIEPQQPDVAAVRAEVIQAQPAPPALVEPRAVVGSPLVPEECLICDQAPCRCAELIAKAAEAEAAEAIAKAQGATDAAPATNGAQAPTGLEPAQQAVDTVPWAKVTFSTFYAENDDQDAADKVKKAYSIGADGALVKHDPEGFWAGRALRQTVSLAQLHGALASNKRSGLAMLTAGVTEQPVVNLPIDVQRKKDVFLFPSSDGLLVIDSDELAAWPELKTPGDVVRVLAQLGLDADCIVSPSGSSYLHWPGGERGLRGLHTFFAIDTGTDIPRVLDVLFKRAWLAGYGRILVSGSGSLLERSIVDRALGSSNQAIFERGAVLRNPAITQQRAVALQRGQLRQVRAAGIAPLTADEEGEYARLVDAAKAHLAGEAATVRATWAGRLVAGLPEAEREARAAQLMNLADKLHRDLTTDFLVTFNDGTALSVAEILARRDELHGRGIRDPFEPEYGTNKATIITQGQRDGRAKILSRAHGLDVSYYLEPRPTDVSAFDEDAPTTAGAEPAGTIPWGSLIWRSQDGKRGRDVSSKARDKILPALRGRLAWARKAAQWHVWDGASWAPQDDGVGAGKLLHDAVEIGCGDFGFGPEYVGSIEKLLRMGDCLPLPEWDDLRAIPFRNGVLDLASRQLLVVSSRNSNPWALPYDFTPGASCPNIMKWLHDAMGGDEGMVEYALAALAAVLTGRSDLQIFFYLFGPGGTGKSTFARLATALVGQQNAVTTTLERLENERFESALLYGARLVLINDAGKYGGAVEKLMAATGEDWLPNERKNVQQSRGASFIYRGMVMLTSNVPLATSNQTSGLTRRQRSVDFDKVLTSDEREAWLGQGGETAILHHEIPGLVNRLLEFDRGDVARILNNPPKKAARSNFEALLANNHVAKWMVEHCMPQPGHHAVIGHSRELRPIGGAAYQQENGNSHLYPSFLGFCAREKILPIARSRFKSILLDMARTLGHPILNKQAPGLNVDSFHGIRLLGEHEVRYKWHDTMGDEELAAPPDDFL